MASKPRIYLETSVLIEILEKPPEADVCRAIAQVLDDADNNKCEVFTSALTISEVIFAEWEKKSGKLDPEISKKLDVLWHPESSPIRVVPCHEVIAREANEAFRMHWAKDGWRKSLGIDLVHLITAKRGKADKFLTTEGAMEKWAPVMGFSIVLNPKPQEDSDAGTLFKHAQR